MIRNLKNHKLLIGILILGLLCMLKTLSNNSYAYYANSKDLAIIKSTIGEFASKEENPEKAMSADISVNIYMQDQNDSSTYNLVNYIPISGYTVDQKKSGCSPKSSITFSGFTYGNRNIKFNVQENKPNQIICRIYYQKDLNSDITIYALVKDNDYGTKEYGGNKYRFINKTPDSTYDFKGYECSNASAKTVVTFTNNKLGFTTTKPNTCYAYFEKVR